MWARIRSCLRIPNLVSNFTESESPLSTSRAALPEDPKRNLLLTLDTAPSETKRPRKVSKSPLALTDKQCFIPRPQTVHDETGEVVDGLFVGKVVELGKVFEVHFGEVHVVEWYWGGVGGGGCVGGCCGGGWIWRDVSKGPSKGSLKWDGPETIFLEAPSPLSLFLFKSVEVSMGVSCAVVLVFDFFLAKAMVAGDVEVSSGVCVDGFWLNWCMLMQKPQSSSQERHSLSPLFWSLSPAFVCFGMIRSFRLDLTRILFQRCLRLFTANGDWLLWRLWWLWHFAHPFWGKTWLYAPATISPNNADTFLPQPPSSASLCW